MILIQMCGLSGSGKSTLANGLQQSLRALARDTEVLDGDVYRRGLSSDLGFSRADRQQNMRRLSFVADRFRAHGIVAVIAAINPYDSVRQEIRANYASSYLVWVRCSMAKLMQRDTKGLYGRALLPDGHPEKVKDLTGVNDPFEAPADADLVIDTDSEEEAVSVQRLLSFTLDKLNRPPGTGNGIIQRI